MNIKLLDCTLRDGGYVNNWEFSRGSYEVFLKMAKKAGIDYIEVGIMGKDSSTDFNTKYTSFEEIPEIERKRSDHTMYAVMTTIGESDQIDIPPRMEGSVDAIRLAFFKYDLEKALVLGKRIKEKGYLLFFQAMATYMYTDNELEEMVRRVNTFEADAFYMVDSFGTMYPSDVKKMASSIDSVLDNRIGFGFHAHNNLQLAFANDIAFLDALEHANRETVYVDASVYGMGRGAGNSPLELVAGYLNDHHGKNYQIENILGIYKDVIKKEYESNSWGYSIIYYLTSKLKINSAYVWYLMEIKGIRDFDLLQEILYRLPEKDRYTLRKETVNEIISELEL